MGIKPRWTPEAVGQWIRELRLGAGLHRMIDLAALAGMDPAQVSRVENGGGRLYIDRLELLVNACGY